MPNESKSTNDIHRSEGMIFESSEGSATAAAATVLDDILCSCPAYPIFCSSCRLLPVENTKSRSAKSPLDKKAAAEVLRITSNRPQPSYLFSQDINTIRISLPPKSTSPRCFIARLRRVPITASIVPLVILVILVVASTVHLSNLPFAQNSSLPEIPRISKLERLGTLLDPQLDSSDRDPFILSRDTFGSAV
jgi:hypothetical protein